MGQGQPMHGAGAGDVEQVAVKFGCSVASGTIT